MRGGVRRAQRIKSGFQRDGHDTTTSFPEKSFLWGRTNGGALCSFKLSTMLVSSRGVYLRVDRITERLIRLVAEACPRFSSVK